MSLIIDALKKAQQIRLKESKSVPFFENRQLIKKSPKKRKWLIIIGAGVLFIIVYLSYNLIFSKYTYKPISLEPIIFNKNKNQPLHVKEIPKIEINSKVENKTTSITPLKESKNLIKPKYEAKVEKEKLEISVAAPNQERLDSPTDLKYKKVDIRKENPIEKVKKDEKESSTIKIKDESREDLMNRKDIIAQFNLAVSLHNQMNIFKAIKAYQQLIEMDPYSFEAYNNLGVIYLEMGDYENSLKNFKKAIEINPKYEKALINLGITYYLKGDNQKAMEEFQKVLEINPDNVESYIHLGIIYKKMGQWEKGLESYKKALSIKQKNAEAHYNLGILYENMGNKDMAIYHYQKFIEIAEKDYPDLVTKLSHHIRNLMRKN